MSNPILSIQNISKRFGSTQALDHVSLDFYPGEVHILLGENGAGKSTLIKILTGIYQADIGQILLQGDPVNVRNSFNAQALGIAAIHQEPMIFPDLNVAENIFISHRNRGRIVNWRKMYQDAEEILQRLDISLDVRSPAQGLTLASQQAADLGIASVTEDRRVLDIIKLRWGRWVEQGYPTTWENWNVDFPDGSQCHAFSAHPRYHIAQCLEATSSKNHQPTSAQLGDLR